MKIVLFGDSLLGRFNKSLIDQLELAIPNSTVYNCAAGGWNSNDGAKRAEYIAGLAPDFVVLSFGANDTTPWKETVDIATFTNNLETIVAAFSGSKIIALLCPPVSLQSIDQTNEFNNSLSLYNQVVREAIQHHDGYCIEAEQLLKDTKDYHEDDGLHINKLGYDIVIQYISEVVGHA